MAEVKYNVYCFLLIASQINSLTSAKNCKKHRHEAFRPCRTLLISYQFFIAFLYFISDLFISRTKTSPAALR